MLRQALRYVTEAVQSLYQEKKKPRLPEKPVRGREGGREGREVGCIYDKRHWTKAEWIEQGKTDRGLEADDGGWATM